MSQAAAKDMAIVKNTRGRAVIVKKEGQNKAVPNTSVWCSVPKSCRDNSKCYKNDTEIDHNSFRRAKAQKFSTNLKKVFFQRNKINLPIQFQGKVFSWQSR